MPKKLKKEYIEQTGVLIEIRPTDYMVGSSQMPSSILNESADWIEWKPKDEKQFKDFTFDTMSCATFSALNDVENTFNYYLDKNLIPGDTLKWLKDNGYIEDGLFNLSDRFNAILSGTTDKGNYLQNVWSSVKYVGCIPEKMLSFGGNTVYEYLDKKVITNEMLVLASQFKDKINVVYGWNEMSKEKLIDGLKEAPLQAVINNGTHAVELINISKRFDTYPPFIINQKVSDINYAMKGIVTFKKKEEVILKRGSKGEDVKRLQTILGITIDGDFGPKTEKAVKDFQKKNGLIADGIVGPNTWKKLNSIKTVENEPILTITRGENGAKQTLGEAKGVNGSNTITFKTLELPWRNNEVNVSCIPTGEYTCKITNSPKFGSVYEVQNVNGRKYIYIHIGNYFSDIKGCIIVGNAFYDINRDGYVDVINSRLTFKRMISFFEGKDFKLIIK